ncbi:unnamed protein product [Ranitomeya imitator]|uniref:Uncharacterized protein n=1 Tax=Ranitomeya imitator TaxID=111125 RepID=A0ABN9L4X2_9NEOB|nr:unnamed protein product [Ranitomeya imitator]
MMLIATGNTVIVSDTVRKNIVIEEIVEGVLTGIEDQTVVDGDQTMNTVGPRHMAGPLRDMEVMNVTVYTCCMSSPPLFSYVSSPLLYSIDLRSPSRERKRARWEEEDKDASSESPSSRKESSYTMLKDKDLLEENPLDRNEEEDEDLLKPVWIRCTHSESYYSSDPMDQVFLGLVRIESE